MCSCGLWHTVPQSATVLPPPCPFPPLQFLIHTVPSGILNCWEICTAPYKDLLFSSKIHQRPATPESSKDWPPSNIYNATTGTFSNKQMAKGKQKNKINKRKGNMTHSEYSYATTDRPLYPNTTKAQESDFKSIL